MKTVSHRDTALKGSPSSAYESSEGHPRSADSNRNPSVFDSTPDAGSHRRRSRDYGNIGRGCADTARRGGGSVSVANDRPPTTARTEVGSGQRPRQRSRY